jgi:hypothetical protein
MVVEDKVATSLTNGQVQVVIVAIATFQYNNQVHYQVLEKDRNRKLNLSLMACLVCKQAG